MTKLKSLHHAGSTARGVYVFAAPALAQERDHGRRASRRAAGIGRQPRLRSARSEAQRAAAAALQQPRSGSRAAGRSRAQRAAAHGRAAAAAGRDAARDNRGNANRALRQSRNDGTPLRGRRAVPRGNVYAPHYAPRYSPPLRAARLRVTTAVAYYYRPYVFRPRFSIGFGIYAGLPGAVHLQLSVPDHGLRIPGAARTRDGHARIAVLRRRRARDDARTTRTSSWTAATPASVQDFDGTTQPLTLAAGTHRIEVQAQGYAADGGGRRASSRGR